MIAEVWVRCPGRECDGSIAVKFEAIPGEPRTRHYPGSPPSLDVWEVVSADEDCDCDPDDLSEEDLLDAVADAVADGALYD